MNIERINILRKEYHPNNIVPFDKLKGFKTKRKYKWICKEAKCGCIHEWEQCISIRYNDLSNCPFCSKVNSKKHLDIHQSIVFTHPKLVEEFDLNKNILKPEQLHCSSNTLIWWKCRNPEVKCNCHKWKCSVYQRTKHNTKCPFCAIGNRICIHESIVYTHPHLIKEIHQDNKIDITTIGKGSNKMIKWICQNDKIKCKCHIWNAHINTRIRDNNGCPYCSRHVRCPHMHILYEYPKLNDIIHPTKNKGINFSLFTLSNFSEKQENYINFICQEGHEYRKSIIFAIKRNYVCPICSPLNLTETSMYHKVLELFPDTIQDHKINNCVNPETNKSFRFDIIISSLMLILECDGLQHFKRYYTQTNVFFSGTYEDKHKRDLFKQQKALKEGYSIIRFIQKEAARNIDDFFETRIKPLLIQTVEPSVVYIQNDLNDYNEFTDVLS